MENEQTLTGIELRKAVLEAAGWVVGEWESGLYNLLDSDGMPRKASDTPNTFIAAAFITEADAWQSAPAVESSVDAAERLLLQGTNYNIRRNSGLHWVDIESCIHLGRGEDSPLAEVICRRFLAWKAGA